MTLSRRQNLHVKWVFISITTVAQSFVRRSYRLYTDRLNDLYHCICWPGYCGADIKAICSEAALCALRRRYPQIYSSSQKLVLDVNSIAITSKDFMCAMSKMVPASQRYNQNSECKNLSYIFSALCLMQLTTILIFRAVVSPSKALIPAIRPLLCAALQDILHTVRRVFPHAEQGLQRRREQGSVCLDREGIPRLTDPILF